MVTNMRRMLKRGVFSTSSHEVNFSALWLFLVPKNNYRYGAYTVRTILILPVNTAATSN